MDIQKIAAISGKMSPFPSSSLVLAEFHYIMLTYVAKTQNSQPCRSGRSIERICKLGLALHIVF